MEQLLQQLLQQLQQQPTTTTDKKERTTGKLPEHKKTDIPKLLQDMNKETSLAYFGIMKNNPETEPYRCIGITRFYNDNNIILTNKYDRIGFTYEHKHIIMLKQLSGETKTTFNKVKQNCLTYLQNKLKGIPTATNRKGQPLTDKQKTGMTTSLMSEINRWNNDKQ